MKKLFSLSLLFSLIFSLLSNSSFAADRSNVIITTNGPQAREVSTTGNDIALLNLHIDTNVQVNFKNFPIKLRLTEQAGVPAQGLLNGALPNLTDIKIVDTNTGQTIAGPIDATQLKTTIDGNTAITDRAGDQIGYFLLDDDFTVRIVEPRDFIITADIANNPALSGATLNAYMQNNSKYPEIRKVSNDAWTTLNPRAPINGANQTIVLSSELSAEVLSDFELINAPAGTQSVNLLNINLTCGNESDCELSEIKYTGYIDDNFDNNFGQGNDQSGHGRRINEIVGSVWLVNGDDEILNNGEIVEANGEIEFTQVNYQIPAGESREIKLFGNISPNAYMDNDGEKLYFKIQIPGDISYSNGDGNYYLVDNITNINNHPIISTIRNGTLSVEVSPQTPNEDIIIAGLERQTVSRFTFKATDEDFVITKLSINNRQINDDISNQSLGNQDNNVNTVTLAYTNALNEVVKKSGILSNGTLQLEGLNIFVPKDESSEIFIYATPNIIQNGATAGEKIDLNLAFNNFEAVAQSSGRTFLADNLDFGDITWSNPNGALQIDGDQINNQELRIDNGNGQRPNTLPLGSLICLDRNRDNQCQNEDTFVTKSWGQTVRVKTLNPGNPIYPDNTPILYALPGANYLTETKPQHLYASKPTLTLSPSSPSGARNVSNTDSMFVFNITANPAGNITMNSVNINLRGSINQNPQIPVACSLKEGQLNIIAQTIADPTNDNSLTLKFRPANNFEIAAGTTKTITLICDTQNLIRQTNDDDLLTTSINFGFANEGQVTSGDFEWTSRRHPETSVRWIGNQGLQIEGNTLRY